MAQAEEEVGLIFARVRAFAQDGAIGVMLDDRVMAGRDVIAAERLRFFQRLPNLSFSLHITHGFGVRPAWYSLEK